jgi:hypothetical protein
MDPPLFKTQRVKHLELSLNPYRTGSSEKGVGVDPIQLVENTTKTVFKLFM